MQFKSQEDAENAAFMLKETFIKDEEKGPVPASVTEPVKVSLKIEPPASPDPEGVSRKVDVTTTLVLSPINQVRTESVHEIL